MKPVEQTELYDHYICGKRGGDSFKNVKRPDSSTKKCPSGTEPCPGPVKPEHQVCYKPEEHGEKCPVTEM